jgi:hypothetical protein
MSSSMSSSMSPSTLAVEPPVSDRPATEASRIQPVVAFSTPRIARPARAALVARLAARISASTREVAPFATVDRAVDSIADRFFRGRRVAIAEPVARRIGASARRLAECVVAADWRDARADATRGTAQAAAFDDLVRAAQLADTLVLTSPFIAEDGAGASLSPRDLLRLRARAPKPVFVLDLLDEDLARAPLTQAALLIPGTVILRGFGRLWRDAGANAAADLGFVAGAPELVAALSAAVARDGTDGGADDGAETVGWAESAESVDEELAAAVVRDLDRAGIERAVQEAATRARVPFRRD